MNLTLGSRTFHVSLLVLAVAAGLLAGALWAGSGTTPAFEAWLAGAKREVANTRTWLARNQLLRLQAARARAEAAQLQAEKAALVAHYDSALAAALAAATTPAESGAVRRAGAACQAMVVSCEGRVLQWARADTADAQRADENAAGWAHADSLLLEGVKARECVVNLLLVRLGCPSRTAAFFTGAGFVELLHLVFHPRR